MAHLLGIIRTTWYPQRQPREWQELGVFELPEAVEVLEAGQGGGEPLQGHLHAASAVRSAGSPRVLLFGSPHRPPIGTLSSQTGQLNF